MRSRDREKVDLVTDISPSDRLPNPLIAEVDTSKIELLGVPGERQENGQFVVNQKVTNLFRELISKEVFSDVYATCGCQFESIKVWLHDTSYPADLRETQFPKVTDKAYCIESPVQKSALTTICVLDNGLEADEYDAWKAACHKLYTPLFHRFVPPPAPPDVLKDFLEMRFGPDLAGKLTLYLDMQNNLFFDALIIQMQQVSLSFEQSSPSSDS